MTLPSDDESGAGESRRNVRKFCHDILNQLFIIQGRAEVVLLELDPGHPLRPDILEVHRACQRAVEITDAWRTRQSSE